MMNKNFFQSCESKECYKIEKERVGLKNVDTICRIHEFDETTNQIKCKTCGRITFLDNEKEKMGNKKSSKKTSK